MTMHLPPVVLIYLAAVGMVVLALSAAGRRWRPHPAVLCALAAYALVMVAAGHLWLPERGWSGRYVVTEMSYIVLVFGVAVVALAVPVAIAGRRHRRLSGLAARLIVTYGAVAAIAGHLWLHLGPRVDEYLEAGGPVAAYTCQVPAHPGAYVCA